MFCKHVLIYFSMSWNHKNSNDHMLWNVDACVKTTMLVRCNFRWKELHSFSCIMGTINSIWVEGWFHMGSTLDEAIESNHVHPIQWILFSMGIAGSWIKSGYPFWEGRG